MFVSLAALTSAILAEASFDGTDPAVGRWSTCTYKQMSALNESEQMRESWTPPERLVAQVLKACEPELQGMRAKLPAREVNRLLRKERRELLDWARTNYEFRASAVF
jgi:hypothetical protein